MGEPVKIEKLLKIDRGDCKFIFPPEDACYYFFNYIVRQKPPYSPGNQLIRNFKKEVLRKDNPSEWQWKINAIEDIAGYIMQLVKPKNPANTIFVPIPPSKAKDSPEYDDRLLQVLNRVEKEAGLNYADILYTKQSANATHLSDKTRTPEQQLSNIGIDHTQDLDGKTILLFDDLITSGAHFKACQQILKKHYPASKVVGIFIGRSINTTNWGSKH